MRARGYAKYSIYVYARASHSRAGATRTEIASARLHARFPAPLFPSYHHHSLVPLLFSPPHPHPSSSSSPPPHTHTHTHTHSRAHPRALAASARLRKRPSSSPRARSRTFRRRFFYRGCCCCCCCCNRIGSCAIPGIEFREWCNHTRLFPRRFCLPPCACQLRYRTFVVAVVTAAVAAFLRQALSLGLNPKDGPRALATAGSSLSRAYYCCCCCCSCTPPALFLEFNSGDMWVCLLRGDR